MSAGNGNSLRHLHSDEQEQQQTHTDAQKRRDGFLAAENEGKIGGKLGKLWQRFSHIN